MAARAGWKTARAWWFWLYSPGHLQPAECGELSERVAEVVVSESTASSTRTPADTTPTRPASPPPA